MSEQEWLNIFADNLEEILRERGMTQKELADELGVTKACVSNYLNKKRIPTIKTIVNIGYVLNIDFNDLIFFGDRVY